MLDSNGVGRVRLRVVLSRLHVQNIFEVLAHGDAIHVAVLLGHAGCSRSGGQAGSYNYRLVCGFRGVIAPQEVPDFDELLRPVPS